MQEFYADDRIWHGSEALSALFIGGRTWFLKKSLKSGKVSIHYACID
jgi:hypothetical protein